MGPACWSPCITPALPTVADAGVTAMWLPSSPTAAPTPSALLRLQGQAAPREPPHRAAPGAAGGAKGWWTLGVVPKTCQV